MKKSTLLVGFALSVTLAHSALAADKPALLQRSAALQCADRKIELKGACYKEDGYPGLSCTSLRFIISDKASGRELGGQAFKPAPIEMGDSYPIVAEKVGEVTCVETEAKEKFIVATVNNGGNCSRCEWHELYSWDGSRLGSSLDAKKNPAIDATLKATESKKAKIIGQGGLNSVRKEPVQDGH
ncbi:hypothetical protein D0T24_07035 [Duganella sp. BJB480]|uniref:hypothetical protein n=1 Tax=unclassified Duganella TaxID=2636909 RepID=UPI000EEDEA85|nr:MULTISPECIES: hypothetical protein [unclassified Duganella]RFP37726.1 hypothetical protein D0T24_07035 [Duganella sp. BJB480]